MIKKERVGQMREYLFEMHAHTSQTSRCGEVPAE